MTPQTKTAEELVREDLKGIWTCQELDSWIPLIAKLMTLFANQEKRSTATGFWKWAMDKYISHSQMGFWDGSVPPGDENVKWISPESAYDLYVIHLQSLTPINKEG